MTYLPSKVLQCPAFHPKCYNVLPSIRVFAMHYDLCPLLYSTGGGPGSYQRTQSVCQSVSQSVSGQSVNHSISGQSVSQWSVSQSVSRSVNQSVNLSVNQSVRQDCFPLPVIIILLKSPVGLIYDACFEMPFHLHNTLGLFN